MAVSRLMSVSSKSLQSALLFPTSLGTVNKIKVREILRILKANTLPWNEVENEDFVVVFYIHINNNQTLI